MTDTDTLARRYRETRALTLALAAAACSGSDPGEETGSTDAVTGEPTYGGTLTYAITAETTPDSGAPRSARQCTTASRTAATRRAAAK